MELMQPVELWQIRVDGADALMPVLLITLLIRALNVDWCISITFAVFNDFLKP